MFGLILFCILIVVIGVSINGAWPYVLLFGICFISQVVIRIYKKK